MRANTTSLGTTGLATRYTLGQTAVVATALTATVVAGVLALSYATVAAAFLAGGASTVVGRTTLERLRAVAGGDRERRTVGAAVTDEA
ncbi:MAG: hypothetical protein ABEJ40_02740 [Haloarculaceae archaeon]